MRHWMTFAGQEMVVLLMLLAFLFFAPGLRRRSFYMWTACVVLLGTAVLLNETRTVWLGLGLAGIWLLWGGKRWMVAAGPVLILLLVLVVPGPVHARFVSILRPQKNIGFD